VSAVAHLEKVMRPFLFFRLPAVGGLVLCLALSGASRAVAAPPELKKIHVVLAVDTDSDLADSVRIDLDRVRGMLEDALPRERFEIKEFTGRELTRANLLAHVRDPRLKVGPDSGLVFYYGGHGAIEPGTGHYLKLKHGPVMMRSELRQAMEARKPGLVVLLTDCCSTHIRIPKPPPTFGDALDPKALPELKRMKPVFRSLFYQARGTVDITAATDNASWGDDDDGGIFTRTLCRVLYKDLRELDRDRDGVVSWKEFFPVLQAETDATFQTWAARMRRNRESVPAVRQKPFAFALVAAPPVQVVVAPPPTSKESTFAVISLENRTATELRFQYRWTNQPDWKSASLASNGRLPVFVAVDGPLGDAFEMEIKFEGRNGVGHLAPRIWKGKGTPSFADGELTTISLRKK
jgi:hypothetical protein